MLTLRDDKHESHRAPATHDGHHIHEEDRMGLLLLAVGLLAFGLYTAFFFASLLPHG